MSGLTAARTADGVGGQLWFSQSLAGLLAEWDKPMAHAGLRTWVAGARRRVDEHVTLWRQQLPESVLLEPDDRVRAPEGVDTLMEAAAYAGGDAPEQSRALARLLDAARTDLDELLAEAGPVSDGALLRSGALVRADLERLAQTLPTC
ncbi:MAG: hypothetical protein OEW42_04600 [Acidimicrobiia bacterium]|nr:hypothetical protein [Acidimicrobiia bacterium]MDH5236402.1 hypothetical protein [Acidimicrobiia bacterium]